MMLACLAAPTFADEAPVVVKHADLSARIRVAGFASPVEVRQSGQKVRLDVNAGGVAQSYIADRDKGVLISMTATAQGRLALVFPLDHSDGVVPLPLDLSVFNAAKAQVKTVGSSLVNGRPCRLMQFAGYLNQSGMLCVSADSVILRMTAAGRTEPLFEIIDLSLAAQDPTWFRAPADFTVAVAPSIGGASGTPTGDSARLPDAGDLPKVTYSQPKTQP